MLQKEEGAEHMAMTTCKECGKQVSTEAKACPHCGAAAPAKKKAKGGIGKWLLIVFAIGLVAMILPKQDKTTSVASAPPKAQAKSPPLKKAEKVLPDVCKITKKDGTLDARECDLEELCKDWVFYRRKAVEYSSEGNEAKAADAQRSFKQTNIWLSAYREEDVQACLKRHGG
jgi:hypothetical protein